jgi:hypothetical protein
VLAESDGAVGSSGQVIRENQPTASHGGDNISRLWCSERAFGARSGLIARSM